MQHKQYPKTIVLRRGLWMAGGLLLIVIIGLILFNLNTTAQRNLSSPHAEHMNTANLSDTQWFTKEQNLHAPHNFSQQKIKLIHRDLTQKLIPPIFHLPNSNINQTLQAAQDIETQAMHAAISSNVLTSENIQSANTNLKNAKISSTKLQNDPNQQGEKRDFLNAQAESDEILSSKIKNSVTPYELQAGSIIPGVLISGINSDLPGFITGQVRESIYDSVSGKYLLIPQGTKILGRYDSQIVYGQERVLVVWHRLLFPNGQSLSLEGMPGVDMRGYAGFADQVNNHYLKIFGSVLLMSVMSSGAQLSQPDSDNTNNNPNVSQTLAASVGSNMALTMDQMTRKNLNIQPTLEIRPGYIFNIMVTKDLVFDAPYVGEFHAQ